MFYLANFWSKKYNLPFYSNFFKISHFCHSSAQQIEVVSMIIARLNKNNFPFMVFLYRHKIIGINNSLSPGASKGRSLTPMLSAIGRGAFR